jgi:hypothetical protein
MSYEWLLLNGFLEKSNVWINHIFRKERQFLDTRASQEFIWRQVYWRFLYLFKKRSVYYYDFFCSQRWTASFCDKVSSRSKINQMWILKTSKYLLDVLNGFLEKSNVWINHIFRKERQFKSSRRYLEVFRIHIWFILLREETLSQKTPTVLLVIKSGKSLVGERVNTKSTKNGKGATRNHSLEFLIGGELKLSSMDWTLLDTKWMISCGTFSIFRRFCIYSLTNKTFTRLDYE